MTDQDYINQAVERAERYGLADSHLCARIIAAAWHGGMDTALYSLASTGAIHPMPGAPEHDTRDTLDELDERDPEQRALALYVRQQGPRGPQAGWDLLSW